MKYNTEEEQEKRDRAKVNDSFPRAETPSGIDNVPLRILTHFLVSPTPSFPPFQLFRAMSLTDSAAIDVARSASLASRRLATLSNAARNEALTALHHALDVNRGTILAANAKDLEAANRAADSGDLSHSVIKRLDLSRPGKYDDMLEGILSVRDLEDPGMHSTHTLIKTETDANEIVGKVTLRTLLDDGLTLERVSCPIGVLLIIFEARPEVIANIAALAIKSGNAAILKGTCTPGKVTTAGFIDVL
jgi:glutamate-5-semialdehyde dehydrogenase